MGSLLGLSACLRGSPQRRTCTTFMQSLLPDVIMLVVRNWSAVWSSRHEHCLGQGVLGDVTTVDLTQNPPDGEEIQLYRVTQGWGWW